MTTQIDQLETELFNRFNSVSQMSSWIDFLEITYDTANENKQYYKCSLINDLIAKELQKLY